jgi:predicted metal-dependent phosphotriesterase family hydrolase
MKEAASNGAWIEFVYNGLIGPFKEFEFADYAQAIRAVGVDQCVLSSDMGHPANPPHPDGLISFFKGLGREGFTSAEIDVMSKKNPARILGLD